MARARLPSPPTSPSAAIELNVVEGGHDLDATRVIDASGQIVAPGFIDLHSHSGLMILVEPRHEPKVRQGVTTEIVGVDGLSYAPLPSTRRPRRADRDERGSRRPTGRPGRGLELPSANTSHGWTETSH